MLEHFPWFKFGFLKNIFKNKKLKLKGKIYSLGLSKTPFWMLNKISGIQNVQPG